VKPLAAALLLLALTLVGNAWAQTGHRSGTEAAEEIVPRFLLMDPNGRAVSSEDFRGRFQLITFGYTACPDICPTTLAEMAAVLKELGPRSDKIQPIFITVDPERDTASVLKAYTAFFDPRIVGLTGSPVLVRRAADNFRVRYEKVRDPADPPQRYAVDHSAGLYLIGPDGRLVRRFAYSIPIATLVDQIGQSIDAR
jgi:protein SCO1/2